MHNNYPNLVLAYHGCDIKVRDEIILGSDMKRSENPYDWLGHGIYFWENDEKRAYEWALSLKSAKKIETPAVVGAVLDLGNCLNLMDRDSIEMLRIGYQVLKEDTEDLGITMPENINIQNDDGWLLRNRDCAVIGKVHQFVKENNLTPYDSVRGLFEEGDRVYPGSGFKEKTHVQICVINPNCIIGCFIPREPISGFPIP